MYVLGVSHFPYHLFKCDPESGEVDECTGAKDNGHFRALKRRRTETTPLKFELGKFYEVPTTKFSDEETQEQSVFRLDEVSKHGSKAKKITWCYSKSQISEITHLDASKIKEGWYISTHEQTNFPLVRKYTTNKIVNLTGVYDMDLDSVFEFKDNGIDESVGKRLLYRGNIATQEVQDLWELLEMTDTLDESHGPNTVGVCHHCKLKKRLSSTFHFTDLGDYTVGSTCAMTIRNVHHWMNNGHQPETLEDVIKA
jgi:hypothetical protein